MKKIIFILFAVVSWQHALAQNFTYDGLRYTVTSATTVKVGVDGQGGVVSGVAGAVAIPSNVTYNSSTYSVTSLNAYVFFGGGALTSIIIPDTVLSIGDGAFYGCSSLTSVTLGNSVTSIGARAFESCSVLSSIIIPNSVTSIGGRAFISCAGLTSIDIPTSVTSIGDLVFSNCSSLTSVTIPNSLTSIGIEAFSYCSSLTSVTIPNSVTSIGSFSFFRCSGLTSIIIPNSVASIGYGAFAFCNGLTSVNIGNAVTSIGDYAFYDCTGLTSLLCAINTPLTINSNVFGGVNQGACSLTVPNGSLEAYQAASVWQDFAPINNCTVPTPITTTINACGSYTWAATGQTYTESGIYTATTTNCVTEQLDLTVTPSSINTTTIAACNSYTWNGTIYTTSGIKTGTTTNCVMEQLDLTITTGPTNTTTISTCGSYIWAHNAQTYTESGTYTDTSANCATEALNLTITPYTTNTTTISACDSFTWANNGLTYTSSGTYTGTTTNCASEVLNLTITPSTTNITTDSACGSYTWGNNNQTYTESGTYAGTTTNCVAEVLILSITPSTNNTTPISACGSYIWANNGQSYTQSGIYSGTTTNCVTQLLNLTINPLPNSPVISGNLSFCGEASTTLAVEVGSTASLNLLTEGFENGIPTNWLQQNNSAVIGLNPNYTITAPRFPGFDGRYVSSNYRSADGANTISNWLMTPELSLQNGNTFSFWTRTYSGLYPDRLQVRMSTNGSSDDVGNSSESVGDFSTLLLDINPTLNTTSYPTTWTKYTVTISGLPTASSGRLAFRYYVTNGGPQGANSDIIAIDSVKYNGQLSDDFSWSTGATTSSITITQAGEYSVTATNSSGCSTTSIVTVSNTPTTNTTNIAACGSYTWANNGQTYTESGTYTGSTTNCITEVLDLTINASALQTTFSTGGINYVITSPTTVAVGEYSAASGSISIPDNVTTSCGTYTVTSINEFAFNGNVTLTSVTIPDSVISIGNNAFSQCTALTSVAIGNAVTSIGDYAFFLCSGLTSVTIPNSVTSMGSNAFAVCYGLTSVTISNNLTSLGTYAFSDCSSLTSVSIPSSVTSIGNAAFFACTGLTSVSIPNLVTSIGSEAFASCSGLTSVIIGNAVTSIGENAFQYCTGLTSVTIPNSVTTIGAYAFRNCTGLTVSTIGNEVTNIGVFAFSGCSNLTSVTCNVIAPLTIESNVFNNVNQGACSLTVPAGSIAAYQAAAVWKDFAPITCANPTVNTTTVTECGSYIWANNNQSYDTSGTYTFTTTNCVTEVLNLTINTIPSVPSLSLLDQHCDDVSGYLGLKAQNQTFTAGATGNLDKISMYLGNPNGDASVTTLTVKVYEGSGTTGTLLGSQTYTYPAQWGYQNVDFNFSTIAVVQGQVYTFKLSTPSVSHGFLGINTENTYVGGSLDFASSSDMIFKTYVNLSNQTFCQGATLNDLKADVTNVKWYNAANGGDQLNSTALLETGTYFASQTGNLCESERVAVNVLVNPTTAFTSQPVASFICSTVGSTASFSVVSNAVSPTYTWQYRVVTTANSNPEWITITSANAPVYANFNTATLTVTKTATLPATGTQYRVLVSGTCGSATSDAAALTILSTVKAGTIASAASVCIGGDITLTLGAYAGSSFQWQSAATATGVFTNIAGATGTTYTIAGATATMDKSYRVIVINSCNTTTATTAIKTLKVDPTSVAGTVTGGGTICSGNTGTLKVAGNIGTIQWQSSIDGTNFVNVAGTAATYTATNITAATYFRAKITSGVCSVAYSNDVKYTIEAVASAGTLTAANATVCSGTATTLTLAGSVGTIKWLKSTNWTAAIPTWTAVTTSTTGNLATGNLTAATAYKAEVTIGSCSTVTSQVVPVLVNAAPLAKTITANVTSPSGTTALLAICTTSSTSKVLTIATGSNGAIQWQKSTASTTTGFADIADATGTSYTITKPAVGANYYRAKFTNSCGVIVYSSAFTVYYKDCTVAKTRVKPVVENAEFKVIAYPNPYTDNFNLSLTTSSVDKVTVSVYDMVGKLLDQREVSPKAVSSIQVGDNYPSGVYNVIVTQGENKKTVRVVKR